MKHLFLVPTGHYEFSDDPEQQPYLSSEGRAQMHEIGSHIAWMHKGGIENKVIRAICSPAQRADQSCEVICKELNIGGYTLSPMLWHSFDSPDKADICTKVDFLVRRINPYDGAIDTLVVVSHHSLIDAFDEAVFEQAVVMPHRKIERAFGETLHYFFGSDERKRYATLQRS